MNHRLDILGRARRRAVKGTALAALTFGGLLATAGQADALPERCDPIKLETFSAHGYCSGGTGYFSGATRCDKPRAPDYTAYVNWAKTSDGQWSYAYCNGNDRAYSPYYRLIDNL